MSGLLLLCGLGLLSQAAGRALLADPAPLVTGGYTYTQVSKPALDFNSAEAACKSNNGHLMSFGSWTEINSTLWNPSFYSGANAATPYWIGLTARWARGDDPNDPWLMWNDGTRTSYLATQMSSLAFEECSKKHSGADGQCCGAVYLVGPEPYNSVFPAIFFLPCNQKHAYLCEAAPTGDLAKASPPPPPPRPPSPPRNGPAPLNCAPGTYILGGQCVKCEPGTYNPARNSDQCFPCAYNQFSNKAGATRCKKCAKGQYTTSMGATSCAPCVSGKFSIVDNTQVCQAR